MAAIMPMCALEEMFSVEKAKINAPMNAMVIPIPSPRLRRSFRKTNTNNTMNIISSFPRKDVAEEPIRFTDVKKADANEHVRKGYCKSGFPVFG